MIMMQMIILSTDNLSRTVDVDDNSNKKKEASNINSFDDIVFRRDE